MPALISKMASIIGTVLYRNLIAICLLLACAFLSDLAFSLVYGHGQGWSAAVNSVDECADWEICELNKGHFKWSVALNKKLILVSGWEFIHVDLMDEIFISQADKNLMLCVTLIYCFGYQLFSHFPAACMNAVCVLPSGVYAQHGRSLSASQVNLWSTSHFCITICFLRFLSSGQKMISSLEALHCLFVLRCCRMFINRVIHRSATAWSC